MISKSKLLGDRFPLSPGASDRGETRISALRFYQDYTQRSTQSVFAVRSQFSLGLDLFDATVNENAPDGRFVAWRGQGQYVRLLAPDTLFIIRSDLQLASRAIVPLEQIGLGGLQSVRGYRQDALLADNGFITSAEVKLPILKAEEMKGILSFVPFIDFGIGWNNSGNEDLPDDTLLGVGMGLQWEMGDRLNARLDWGIPLIELKNRDRTLQEDGIYFSVHYGLF